MPSFLLVLGAMPYWGVLRDFSKIKAFLVGVNACVIGFLISALYNPILTSVITDFKGIVLILFSILIIYFLKITPWITVIVMAIIGKTLDMDFFSNVVIVKTSEFVFFENSLIIFFRSLLSIKSTLFKITYSFFLESLEL